MQDMNDQVMARLAKLDKFKEMGVDAYPHKFNRTHDSKVLKENKDALMVTKQPVAFAGRVVRFNRKGIARARCALCTSRTAMAACRLWLPVTKWAKKTTKS